MTDAPRRPLREFLTPGENKQIDDALAARKRRKETLPTEVLMYAKEIACDPWTYGAHVSAVMADLYEALTGEEIVRG